MTNFFANKKTRAPTFQVLLLSNDADEQVEVQEADQVDFFQVQEHLKNGGSVFITPKEAQKLISPKTRTQQNYNKSRRINGSNFRQVRKTFVTA